MSQSGALQTLVQMVSAADSDMKASAIWALANMAYTASPAVNKTLLQALPWRCVESLLQRNSPDIEVWFSLAANHFLNVWVQSGTFGIV